MYVTSGMRGILGFKEINCVLLGAGKVKKIINNQYLGISVSKTTKGKSITRMNPSYWKVFGNIPLKEYFTGQHLVEIQWQIFIWFEKNTLRVYLNRNSIATKPQLHKEN